MLPLRLGQSGPEVLLITSRESRRWIIPKGWPMKGLKPHQAAAQEAREEAGISGKVSKRPIGTYTYVKRLTNSSQPCRVTVYRLDVEEERDKFRERGQRARRWLSLAEAVDLVDEPSLAALLNQVRQTLSAVSAERPAGPSEPAAA